MAESQSRYSIVERLTQRKLEIMSSKSKLKEDIKAREEKVDRLKKDLENWKKDIQEDIKRERRMKELEVDRVNQDAKNAKDRMKEKEGVFDNQIKAIDEALRSLEEISKTSPTIQG